MADKVAWQFLILFCREADASDPQPLAAFWDMNEAKAFAGKYQKQIGEVHIHEHGDDGFWHPRGSMDVQTFNDHGDAAIQQILEKVHGGETAG